MYIGISNKYKPAIFYYTYSRIFIVVKYIIESSVKNKRDTADFGFA